MTSPRILYWLCVVMSLLNAAGGIFLSYYGLAPWGCIIFSIYWGFLAWIHSKRIEE